MMCVWYGGEQPWAFWGRRRKTRSVCRMATNSLNHLRLTDSTRFVPIGNNSLSCLQSQSHVESNARELGYGAKPVVHSPPRANLGSQQMCFNRRSVLNLMFFV